MPLVLDEGTWEKLTPKLDVVWHGNITADHHLWKLNVASGSLSSLSSTTTDMNGFDIYFLMINYTSNGTYVYPLQYFL